VTLSDEDREVLERWARRPSTAQALAMRARIVSAAARVALALEDAAPTISLDERDRPPRPANAAKAR
jgi:hypothetical protein